MSMDQDIKRQWLCDLRDPDRKQTQGILRDEQGGQCCLDVLNEQGVKAGIQDTPDLVDAIEVDVDDHERVWAYKEELGDYYQALSLTTATMRWAGIEDSDPQINWAEGNPGDIGNLGFLDKPRFSLSYLNDKYAVKDEEGRILQVGLTFAQIAEIIEADESF